MKLLAFHRCYLWLKTVWGWGICFYKVTLGQSQKQTSPNPSYQEGDKTPRTFAPKAVSE